MGHLFSTFFLLVYRDPHLGHFVLIMICSTVVHTSSKAVTMIKDVTRCHDDLLATVHGLKIKVEIMDTKNKHLIERVRILEQRAEEKRIGDEKQLELNQTLFTKTVDSLKELNNALTVRVTTLEGIAAKEKERVAQENLAAEIKRTAEIKRAADEKRATDEKQSAEKKRVAEEKRAAEEKLVAEKKRVADEKRDADEKRALEEKSIDSHCVVLMGKDKTFPLHLAAREGASNKIIDRLLGHYKQDVKAKSGNGWTSLHHAASHATTTPYCTL